jgi:putative chitinase
MKTTIDRAAFFASIKPTLFSNHLAQPTVNGINAILDEWLARWTVQTPITQFAYVLATPWLETDRTMMPIHEYGNTAYFKRMYDINGARPAKARELGNVHPGDGAKFPGMGLVQSTGRANALRATKRMRELGLIDHTVDFEQTPELLMMPKYAVPILFIGMEEGWFTGVTLDKTIDTVVDGDEFADFVQARRIINGQDRADKIAVAAVHFLQALQKSVQVV